MNYYEKHLGDYARDTAHLSMLEHGAYNLLMDRYYATEQGIPADQAHRLSRARSKEERDAVDSVLKEYFTLDNGVWVKNRIQEEINKAQRNINAARENGSKGGRPKSKPRTNPEQTQQEPNGLLLGSVSETQSKALQTPDTRHQSPTTNTSDLATARFDTSPQGETSPRAAVDDQKQITPEGEMAVALRDQGVLVSSMHPVLVGWITAGFSTQQALDATALARMRKPYPEPIPAAYIDRILREPRRTPVLAAVNGATAPRLRTADEIEADELARGDAHAQH